MNDGLDLVFPDDGRYQILVPGLPNDEEDARGDRPVESGRKIVNINSLWNKDLSPRYFVNSAKAPFQSSGGGFF
jgi:hypothetical protein